MVRSMREDLDRAVHGVSRRIEAASSSKLASEFAEAFEQRHGLRRGGHDDLAAIARLIVSPEEAELDETVGQPACGRRSDPKPSGKIGHPQLAGGHHDVQDLGLGHRDPDIGELRSVALDEAVHQGVIAIDDGVDGCRRGLSIRIG
jgi:hypothetical protein